MKELFTDVNKVYCSEICDRWSVKMNDCLWKYTDIKYCFYTKQGKIKKMQSERHHLKSWTKEYIAKLQGVTNE